MDITRCLVGVSVGAEREREREKRGLTYSCCTAEEEERIRSEVLTCAAAAPLLNTGNGEGERRASQMLFFQRYGPHRQLLTVDSIQFNS